MSLGQHALDWKSSTLVPNIAPNSVRTVMLVTANAEFGERLRDLLTGLRWQVQLATGGASAIALLESVRSNALILDSWLPDLEVDELAAYFRQLYPAMDVVFEDGRMEIGNVRSPQRNELLHALRQVQQDHGGLDKLKVTIPVSSAGQVIIAAVAAPRSEPQPTARLTPDGNGGDAAFIPGMIGRSQPMSELARLIRLVAPRSATVLIEGETGTGKEVVANALHRMSGRASKAFTVLNCAAIPEALLEAELFGHTRGAFTGADKARIGRIEAADGGTLFLDEIGEMPLALQAKMLRFLDSGELQRVGSNELTRVNVRIIAATHQPLEQRATEHLFRLDLYHRLAVFPIEVPALRDRIEDLPLLVTYILDQMGRDTPIKGITNDAMARLRDHRWPGNVRELMHVLERGSILAHDRPEIGPEEIRLRRAMRK